MELGCSVVQLFTRLANTTWEFVCDKVRTMSREHRRMLMIIAAAATGVLAVGSVVLWLVCRKSKFPIVFYNRAGGRGASPRC